MPRILPDIETGREPVDPAEAARADFEDTHADETDDFIGGAWTSDDEHADYLVSLGARGLV